MPHIGFQPVLRSIREVLKSDFYTIPRFQRPYSWSSENLDDFWRDVVIENDEGYFIGPMVSFRIGKGLFGVVDGQQRITSITLALCVLRDRFLAYQAKSLADGLTAYIERADDDSVSHFVLRSQSEKIGNFLTSQFQAPPPRSERPADNDEQRNLRKAFNDISGWIDEQLSEVELDSSEPADDAANAAIVARLKEIRDKILGLQVIWIQLDSEDDAYIIFETLNSRGKDLEVVDLLKNHLLQHVRAQNGDLDTARTRWSTMRETLEVEGAGANPNKFLLHWWLSKADDFLAERLLYKRLRKGISKVDAPVVLAELEETSKLYARIANPSGYTWSRPQYEVRDSLLALNLFSVRQPRPLILSLLRAYEDGIIKLAKVKAVLRALESFHFVTTAVVGVSSTGGISMMYASHARDLYKAKNSQAAAAGLDRLVSKLHDRLSERSTFLTEFRIAVTYDANDLRTKRLLAYSLRKLHDHAVTGRPLDHSKCNVEHISAQTHGEAWTNEIGNLLWIDEKLNGELGSKDFDAKRTILLRHQGAYDTEGILKASQWTQAEVRARTVKLAERAYDKVWRVK